MVDITDFSNGNYISVGFIDAESTKPLVEEIARIFNKKSNDTTLQKGLSELKKSIDKNTETTKKNNDTNDLVESIKSLQKVSSGTGGFLKLLGGPLLKTMSMFTSISVNAIKQFGKATETLRVLESTGISLNRGFVELKENANIVGVKTEEMAKLLAQSTKTLLRFNNSGKDGVAMFSDFMKNLSDNLYTSNEYNMLLNDYVQNNPLSKISSPSFKSDFELFTKNIKAFSKATGKSVENLLEEQRIKSDKKALQAAAYYYKDEFDVMKKLQIPEEIIMNILSGGTKNAKERLLLTSMNPLNNMLYSGIENLFNSGNLNSQSIIPLLKELKASFPQYSNVLSNNINSTAMMAGSLASDDFGTLHMNMIDIIKFLSEFNIEKFEETLIKNTKDKEEKPKEENAQDKWLKTAADFEKTTTVIKNTIDGFQTEIGHLELDTLKKAILAITDEETYDDVLEKLAVNANKISVENIHKQIKEMFTGEDGIGKTFYDILFGDGKILNNFDTSIKNFDESTEKFVKAVSKFNDEVLEKQQEERINEFNISQKDKDIITSNYKKTNDSAYNKHIPMMVGDSSFGTGMFGTAYGLTDIFRKGADRALAENIQAGVNVKSVGGLLSVTYDTFRHTAIAAADTIKEGAERVWDAINPFSSSEPTIKNPVEKNINTTISSNGKVVQSLDNLANKIDTSNKLAQESNKYQQNQRMNLAFANPNNQKN